MIFFKKETVKRDFERFKVVGLNGVYYRGVRIINAINNDKNLEWLCQAIDELPLFVVNTIVEKRLLIRLDDKKGCEYFKENKNVLGFYNSSNVIYIKKDNKKMRFISTVLHEVGHFVDYNVKEGYIITAVDNERFSNIVTLEGGYIVAKYGSYFSLNNREYFAQAFFAYVMNDCDFQVKCPNLTNYINEVVCKLGEIKFEYEKECV